MAWLAFPLVRPSSVQTLNDKCSTALRFRSDMELVAWRCAAEPGGTRPTRYDVGVPSLKFSSGAHLARSPSNSRLLQESASQERWQRVVLQVFALLSEKYVEREKFVLT